MAELKIVEASSSFAAYLPDGTPFNVAAGDRFRADDPVVKANPAAFGEITVRSSLPAEAPPSAARSTETATAGPGERRSVARPAASRAPGGSKGGKDDA